MEIANHDSIKSIQTYLLEQGAILTSQIDEELERLYMAGPILLANQISQYSPDIVHKPGVTTIMLAGAAFNESVNNGDAYGLLNTLLSSKGKKWHLIFIGNEALEVSINRSYQLDRRFNREQDINVTIDDIFLCEAIKKYGTPDILCMNHPGLESHYQSWLDQDDTLLMLLDENVPILGASYGTDEVDIDKYYFSAYGIDLIDAHTNGCYFDAANAQELQSDEYRAIQKTFNDAVGSGMMDWGRTQWRLTKGLSADADKKALIETISILYSAVGDFLLSSDIISHPFEIYNHLNRIENGNRIVRIYGNISLNLGRWELFDEVTLDLLEEDIEVVVDGYDINDLGMHSTSLLMANVFNDYIRQHL